ncbi:MAG: protein of unknown function acetylesterase [Gemmatimonadetes bacterium]|nr:protein of unknown function acetylesterase [Gemmatimonadota bacterium]
MRLRAALSSALLICLSAAPAWSQRAAAASPLRLARIFGDEMVLQRQVTIPVWGWSTPGADVAVTLDRRARHATADRSGAWSLTFPALPAGGPHTLLVRSGRDSIRFGDILVGDVWVASGQSNMEFPLSSAKNAAVEIASANDSRIRHFKVPTTYATSPEPDLAGGTWASADPQHAGSFSAVAYFFARDLRKSVDVPIGIINTSWGGSRIEPWMSRAALGLDEARWAEAWRAQQSAQQQLASRLRAKVGELPTVDAGLVDGRARWAEPALDDKSWAPLRVPGTWEEAGYEGLDGVAWYRTTLQLTADEAAHGLTLGLGTIDDEDITWVNGVEVGRTSGWNVPRAYRVPSSALVAGSNVVAVRVHDTGGGGGIGGDSSTLFVDLAGARRPWREPWRFKVGAAVVQGDQGINQVSTVLYNKMVHPLLRFPIKGVLWYQGESNADRVEDAVAYAPLFAKLITSWRREWGVGDFPFLWVQLANYMAPDSQPAARSAWATLRESQTSALALRNTAQAVIVDIGEANDIHPKNKQDVGARLALAARKVAYGQSVEYAGPTHRGHTVHGGRIVVQFDHVGGGLVNRASGDVVGGFAIAGADRHFVWADARIQGSTVVVSSSAVTTPVAVRYAWGNDPDRASLANREGLPTVPFRTDAW